MAEWVVAADQHLQIADTSVFDAAAARAGIFAWAGFDTDRPDPDKARRAFLLHDRDAPLLKGSYHLPIGHVERGNLIAVSAALRAAAVRLPEMDAAGDVQDRARALLDGYFRRVEGKAEPGSGELERKYVPLLVTELRAAPDTDKRQIEGYASTFGGDPDAYGDVVVRGAFVESLRQRQPKLLWQHNQEEPIGKPVRLEEDGKGLYGRWHLVNTSGATNAYELIKEGLVEGLSIGFVPREWDYRAADGVRLLHAVDLLEISAVTIPANDNALITGVKADMTLPFDTLLTRWTQALTLATNEAEALAARRAAEGRGLNDRHREAIGTLLTRAEAELGRLRSLAGDAQARADLPKEVRVKLTEARRRLEARGILERSA